LPELVPEIDIVEAYIVDVLLPTFRFSPKALNCYPDVKPTLNELSSTLKIGLITNGDTQVQNKKIDLLKIREHFDAIEISGDYSKEKAKPSTYMLNKMLAEFKINSYEVIYVGDNPQTDRCAIDIGCNFLRIKRKNGMYSELDNSENEYQLLSSLSEVSDFIF